MQLAPLSDHCKAIILGSLLGDGSLKIAKLYKNARFSFRHSISQKSYFMWKMNELKEISSEKCFWKQGENGKDGWGKEKFRYQSLALESLTKLYQLTNKRGRLRIRRKWLNMLTPLSLAIWWLDDGSLVSDSRQGVFCTDGFPLKEIMLLRNYLKKVWSIATAIGKIKRGPKEYYRLWIRSTEELKEFLRIILPHIPVEDMLPKVIMLYKDSKLQQRWISELSNLTKFSRETIEKYMLQKRTKWKHFRE
ncbi:hypothetical protein HZA39_01485 [Candidatus Peregrinibacteria bacterium]|nr:hypothetical protein [Candidatus Peregrinibacteria bacterium]